LGIPGKPPALALMLQHASASTWQQVGLVLFVAEFDDRPLHRFDHGFIQ
jgi:hypothetical protein